jgi:hypothetical protein
MATREEIGKIVNIIKNSSNINLVERDKNRVTRHYLGITYQDQIDLVKNITEKDYYAGPEPDDNKTEGDIWIFKKFEYGVLFYIKIKNVIPLTVISCHIDNT